MLNAFCIPNIPWNPTTALMTRTAIYAGTFDPVTRGHEDLIRRSLSFVDKLVVAVAVSRSSSRR